MRWAVDLIAGSLPSEQELGERRVSGARIGADVGGTFTDVICVGDDGAVSFTKVLSTPPAYDRAVVAAVAELARRRATVERRRARDDRRDERRARAPRRAARARHDRGLPRRARAAPHAHAAPLRLLLDEAAVARPAPRPLRDRRAHGRRRRPCVKPLDEDEAARARGAARATPASRRSPSACCTRTCIPRTSSGSARSCAPSCPASRSRSRARSLREQQEYERTATTVVNAYVAPLMGRYVADLRDGLAAAGVAAPLTVMQSSGGVDDRRRTRRCGRSTRSSPARPRASSRRSRSRESLGHENAIAFDLGGTTAKASLIQDGRVSLSQEYEVGAALSAGSRLLRGSGELIRIPTIDIAEVGAGGGSIAWLDEAGGLHVGPRSAGARPGPACYGLGGIEPTVTDANVVLGYIAPGPLASGALDRLARAGRAGRRRARRAPRPLDARGRARHPRPRERRDDARAPRRLDREGPRPGRLRPRRLRRLGPGARGGARRRARRPHRDRAAARRPLLRGRACSSRAPSTTTSASAGSARASPTSTRSGGSTPRCARRSARRSAASPSGGASPTSATAARAGASRSSCPASSTPPAIAALVERFEDEHEQLYGTRLEPGSPVDIRALRLAALGPQREPFALPAGERDARRHAPRRLRPGPRRARGAGRLARRARGRARARARCSSTSTTRPSSSRRAGRCASTRRATRSCSTLVAAPRRRGRPAHADAIAHAPRRQRARDRRRRDGDDDLPHRALRGRPRRDGLLGRALRRERRDGRAGGHDPAPARLDPERDARRCSSASATSFRPGDVFIVNDPFDGASHTPDIFVAKPSFAGETLIGFAVTVAHHGDIGGRVPGVVRVRQHRGLPGGPAPAVDAALRRGRARTRRCSTSSARTSASRTSCSATSSAQVAACHIGDRALQELARAARRRSGSTR